MRILLVDVKAYSVVLLSCLIFPGPGHAQFYVESARSRPQARKVIDFCRQGKLLVFTGNCSSPKDAKTRDSISEKACADVRGVLAARLPALYPHAQIYDYRGLAGGAVVDRLMQPGLLGFFLIGEGDAKGGFATGPNRDRVYPAVELCASGYDVFGGFVSHSKYSPSVPAPASLRGLILSKTEIIYGGAGAAGDSWPKACKPAVSLVYPTRTFAGRMKNDALKLLSGLEEEKRRQVVKVMETVCRSCDQYVRAGVEAAVLCPPRSDACSANRISPATEKLILENYCLAIPAGMPPEE